ncbi:uncharacterized protein LOC122007408 [Zingiber officinale]|uniref:uncharacterized protein LOC122007408 n=1 Tax=Zingiber officinale TaxID=94328 RepID=UPI001C4BE9DC|nr:uncharacterized protein LOC122007408 [Zingiber officinale]
MVEGYNIQQAFTSVAYPRSNGHAEVVNREILQILRVRLDHIGGSWVDEFPGVLWKIRTTLKEGTGVTPFHLVYGGEAVVLIGIGVESDRIQNYSEDNAERRLLELNLVDEARDKVAIRLMAYRQRMWQSYNQRVIPRSFQVGDLVWKKSKASLGIESRSWTRSTVLAGKASGIWPFAFRWLTVASMAN